MKRLPDAAAAWRDAANLLGYRGRSEAEVRERLQRRGYVDEVIETTLERLRAAGLVDDAAFAQQWVESRARQSPRGRRLLASELRGKGLPVEATEVALSTATTDGELALAAAERKARALRALPLDVARRRLWSHLARRGFDATTISSVVRATLGGQPEEVDDEVMQ
ncbi:MAG: regulatory protein RecX [Chloroflexota bacterium]